MEERHTQIREGAGLEESRINQEFLDWLQKWAPYGLFGVAAIVLAYSGWQYLQRAKLQALDEAFAEYVAAAEVQQDPDRLLDVAKDHAGKGSIEHLARLEAAKLLLECANVGLTPSGRVELAENQTWDGTVEDEAMLADEESIQQYLAKAKELYSDVFDDTKSNPKYAHQASAAIFGLAAVKESLGEADARDAYERAKTFAQENGFDWHAETVDKRLEDDEALALGETLLARADLYVAPTPETSGNVDIETGARQLIRGADGVLYDEEGNPVVNIEDIQGPPTPEEPPAPATDVPSVGEAPNTELPTGDEPSTDEPSMDEPSTDEPSVDPETP